MILTVELIIKIKIRFKHRKLVKIEKKDKYNKKEI